MRQPDEIIIDGLSLAEIIRLHGLWLQDKPEGEQANLQGANLRCANLRGADLQGANLGKADLQDANLGKADLQDANLGKADLQDASLRCANLRGADLRGTNLRGADLQGADNIPAYVVAVTNILPEGDIILWKKLYDNKIAKLLVPSEAKRSNATGRKCRVEYAKVLEIWDGKKHVEEGRSQYDDECVYRVGEIVKPNGWNDDRWNECSRGIHGFITRYEAEQY